ncbi:hypothetical protein MHU86_1803 [Fragilaria crotonensis]|nr:hypothetical protein MHU86_1803 [Fragilaria crotonensis]
MNEAVDEEGIEEFNFPFEAFLGDIAAEKRAVEILDRNIHSYFGPSDAQVYERISRLFPPDHIKRLSDVLTTNSVTRLSFPVDILNQESAVYLGQALNRMITLQELSLSQESSEDVSHLVLAQLDPDKSMLKRLRIHTRLLPTPEFEYFIRSSSTLLFFEIDLDEVSPGDQLLIGLGDALRQSRNVRDLVLNSTTWESLSVLLEQIGTNSPITRLDLAFGSNVGEDSPERQQAILECMRKLGASTTLQTLNISEPSYPEFPHHSFYHVALAEALRTNSSIRTLRMEGAILQDGVDALSDALVVNSTLGSLDFPTLRECSFMSFAQKLGRMKGLKAVVFWGSQMLSAEEVVAIEEGLSQNTSIWHMQFTFNAWNPGLAERIRFHLMANGMGAHELVASAPASLMPHVLAVADQRSLSMLYSFLCRRSDIFYYR